MDAKTSLNVNTPRPLAFMLENGVGGNDIFQEVKGTLNAMAHEKFPRGNSEGGVNICETLQSNGMKFLV